MKLTANAVLCVMVFVVMFFASQRSYGISEISDISVDGKGRIYLLDNSSNEICQLDKNGELIWQKSFAEYNKDKHYIYGLVQLNSNTWSMAIVSNGSGVICVSENGEFSKYMPSVGGYTDRTLGMDSSGDLYFPNKEENRVEKYRIMKNEEMSTVSKNTSEVLQYPGADIPGIEAPVGSIVVDGNVSGAAHLGRPHKVNIDGDGRIWVLDQSYSYKVYDSSGKFLHTVKAPDQKNRSFTCVVDLESDKDGITYVACAEVRKILKYNRYGGLLGTIDTGKYSMGWQEGFAVGPDGLLYFGIEDNTSKPRERSLVICVLNKSGDLVKKIPVP